MKYSETHWTNKNNWRNVTFCSIIWCTALTHYIFKVSNADTYTRSHAVAAQLFKRLQWQWLTMIMLMRMIDSDARNIATFNIALHMEYIWNSHMAYFMAFHNRNSMQPSIHTGSKVMSLFFRHRECMLYVMNVLQVVPTFMWVNDYALWHRYVPASSLWHHFSKIDESLLS